MPKIDEAYVEIGTKMQRFNRGLRAAQVQGERWAKTLGARMSGLAQRGFGFVGRQLQNLGRQLRRLAMVGAAAFVAIEYKALRAGMALIEATSRFGIAMGKYEKQARRWVQGFTKAVRLNESEIADYLAKLHMMLKAQGIAEKESLQMAQALTKRVLDLSSLLDVPIDDMFDKATAAIMGMSRPMQNLGFVINEATSKQWALANGLMTVGKEMDEQQKIMARYGRFMATTSVAHRNLYITLESEANLMRQLKASWTGYLEKLGMASTKGGGFAILLSTLRTRLEELGDQTTEMGSTWDKIFRSMAAHVAIFEKRATLAFYTVQIGWADLKRDFFNVFKLMGFLFKGHPLRDPIALGGPIIQEAKEEAKYAELVAKARKVAQEIRETYAKYPNIWPTEPKGQEKPPEGWSKRKLTLRTHPSHMPRYLKLRLTPPAPKPISQSEMNAARQQYAATPALVESARKEYLDTLKDIEVNTRSGAKY